MEKFIKKINSFIKNKEYSFCLQGADLVEALELPFNKNILPTIYFYRDEINRELPIKHYSLSNVGSCNDSNNIHEMLKVIKEQHDYFLFLLSFIPFIEICFNNGIEITETHLRSFSNLVKK